MLIGTLFITGINFLLIKIYFKPDEFDTDAINIYNTMLWVTGILSFLLSVVIMTIFGESTNAILQSFLLDEHLE